ncbi:MAG: monofunctional biosynthetic peptidoglycan transglycosylase [Oligoflexia bacterium]|nr:monofunctional biosynthetic peptidoglycan transglycosylase [Oligoflexia bacterium]
MRSFIFLLCLFLGFYFLIFSVFKFSTDVSELEKSYPHVIYNAKEKTSRIEIQKNRPKSWVGLGSVSKIAVAAIVLSEDWAFYQHNGFDWQQIRESMETNLKKGKYVRGGSTITQQVVKNIYLSNEKTIVRKLKEAVLAMRIERQLTKKRILELYLNIAEFGEGLYGIGSASWFYFQKPASSLSAKEGAFLAMLLPSPKKYSVSFRKQELTPYAYSTIRSIVGKLSATKRLSQEEAKFELSVPLSFEKNLASYGVDVEPIDEEVIEDELLPPGEALSPTVEDEPRVE